MILFWLPHLDFLHLTLAHRRTLFCGDWYTHNSLGKKATMCGAIQDWKWIFLAHISRFVTVSLSTNNHGFTKQSSWENLEHKKPWFYVGKSDWVRSLWDVFFATYLEVVLRQKTHPRAQDTRVRRDQCKRLLPFLVWTSCCLLWHAEGHGPRWYTHQDAQRRKLDKKLEVKFPWLDFLKCWEYKEKYFFFTFGNRKKTQS